MLERTSIGNVTGQGVYGKSPSPPLKFTKSQNFFFKNVYCFFKNKSLVDSNLLIEKAIKHPGAIQGRKKNIYISSLESGLGVCGGKR